MADPISGLTALAAAPATTDLLAIVDVSDPSQAVTGTTKQLTVAHLFTTPTVTGPVTVAGRTGIECVLVNGTLTGADLFSHAFTDLTSFSSTGTGAYATIDSFPEMTGTIAYNHYYSFQSRHIYSGSGLLDNMAGFVSIPTMNGPVGDSIGLHVYNPLGAGVVQNVVGVIVDQLTRGQTSNYAFRSIGNTPSLLGGLLTVGLGLVVQDGGLVVSLGGADVTGSTTLHGALVVDDLVVASAGIKMASPSAVGTDVGGAIAFNVQGGLGFTSGTTQSGIASQSQLSATTAGRAIFAKVVTQASAFTMTSGSALNIADASIGAGSTLTTQYGIKIDNLTSGGTNYAIHTSGGRIHLTLPTSSAGLASGDWYSNSGVVTVVP